MTEAKPRFNVLLCGRKELMDRVRKIVHGAEDVHLQFTSSPGFIMSRALFHAPNLVLIDAKFERPMLQDVFERFRSEFLNVSIFPIATSPKHEDVVEFMKLGASGCYAFPNDYRKLSDRIQQLIDEWRVRGTQQQFANLQRRAFDFDQIIGSSSKLHATLHKAKKVIENSSLIVLITGETGTGKELLARAIHYNGKNAGSPFVDIACSAIPESLLESELFGFEKGAFTDARERKLGLFELAGEGSIFLDEIGDISPAIQSKLLKVIESRTMRRLGGTQDIPVKARIIAATSVDLDEKMKDGRFRRDLYHRLKILPLEIPPLRERKDDIPALVGAFIGLFNKVYDKKITGITDEALGLLLHHDWEGNIRELKHSIERAMLLEEKDNISAEHLTFLSGDAPSPVQGKTATTEQAPPASNGSAIELNIPLEQASLEEVQRNVALKVLAHVGGNKSKAAFILRISRPRLDRILKNE